MITVVQNFIKNSINEIKGGSFALIFLRLREVYVLGSPASRKYIIGLHLISFFQIFLQLLNVAGGLSILLLLKTPELVYENKYLLAVYEYFQFQSFDQFLVIVVGFTFLLFIIRPIISNIFGSFSIYAGASISRDFTMKLFNFYLQRKYEDRVTDNFDSFLQKGIGAASSATSNTISISRQFIGNIVNFAIVIVALFILNVNITLLLLVIFFVFYRAIYQKSQKRFEYYGRQSYNLAKQKIRTFREGFSGITDVILMGKEKDFLRQTHSIMVSEASLSIKNNLLIGMPPLLIQSLIYTAIFFVGAYTLIYSQNVSFSVLILFSGAAFKLFPMMSSIYTLLGQVSGATHLYEQVITDLRAARFISPHSEKVCHLIKIEKGIQLNHLAYTYKKDTTEVEFAVNDINITIPTGSTIALFGPSGSGKTTIAKLISGIISPDQGEILVDGQPIMDNPHTKRCWQQSIGYVEQKPFFLYGSIAENVAFEINQGKIDYARVEQVIRMVQLEGLINSLPQGIRSDIGDNATLISGGQAQRISIARALYRDGSLMIMDEATNALDSVTASQVLQGISKGGRTVILIAHNLETLRKVDNIFVISSGAVISQGSYDELMESSSLFRAMAAPYTGLAAK